ncbi:cathepsin L1-like isoform X2 [Drosophila bipectinata]|uniref:cathepsin L1-like isoform X2 n=1 Tax=Drosophila bipectinata TaxID=42026 RepID=UPI001C8A6AF2|nr:cathepsin L-like isoform X2 [Drosophila bipectinata]
MMEKSLILFLLLLAKAHATPYAQDILEEEWRAFKIEYNKEYQNETEERLRLKIFLHNKLLIARHNLKWAAGEVSFNLTVNQFSDLLNHEFKDLMFGHSCIFRFEGSTFLPPENLTLPESVDWRNHGFVTPVKNQGTCRSCWAFAATGALEGQHFRKTGNLVSLSEQNLIDCVTSTYGCKGGNRINAFHYIHNNGGIDTESSYSYKAAKGKCHFIRDTIGATCSGFVKLKGGDEMELAKAVATVGPVSVSINPSNSFRHYHSGVYYDPTCRSEHLTHAVLVVGYGTDEKYGDFWIVKNSWGSHWGDKGYIKMKRNANNLCGIASNPSYPLI